MGSGVKAEQSGRGQGGRGKGAGTIHNILPLSTFCLQSKKRFLSSINEGMLELEEIYSTSLFFKSKPLQYNLQLTDTLKGGHFQLADTLLFPDGVKDFRIQL